MHYLAYGLTVEADLDLGTPAVGPPADVVVTRSCGPVVESDIVTLAEEDETGWRTGRRGNDFVLGFTDSALFEVTGSGDRIRWWADGLAHSTLVHLVVDHVLPVAMARRGLAVLHAAVLGRPDGGPAFAIAGRSGWGKSTLATALTGRGYDLLADDCAAITLPARGAARSADGAPQDTEPPPPTVAPAYPGVRLHDHSVTMAGLAAIDAVGDVSEYSDKKRFALRTTRWDGHRSRPLDTIVVLDPPDAGGVGTSRLLGGADALFTLLGHSFHVGDGTDRAATLDRLASLVGSVAVVQLSYARTPTGLERVMDEIAEWTSSTGDVA